MDNLDILYKKNPNLFIASVCCSGVVMYSMAVGQLPFPNASALMRDSDGKHGFIRMVNIGLSDAHVERIEEFPPGNYNHLILYNNF